MFGALFGAASVAIQVVGAATKIAWGATKLVAKASVKAFQMGKKIAKKGIQLAKKANSLRKKIVGNIKQSRVIAKASLATKSYLEPSLRYSNHFGTAPTQAPIITSTPNAPTKKANLTQPTGKKQVEKESPIKLSSIFSKKK